MPRGVIDGQPQVQPSAVRGLSLDVFQQRDQRGRQPIAPADGFQAHAIANAAIHLVHQVAAQQFHQSGHLPLRPAPVVFGERIER